MDFGMLPPEINSGRMYAGPGSGPMVAAAAAWDGLATQLHVASASYESTICGLTAEWQGPAAAAMATAAAPYMAWVTTTAGQAEETATQARAALAAYEIAFAATVSPPVIAANRATLMSLIATNLLGQNTPAIAATEAQYAEMWAQDAATMYGYAGSAASASQLTPFSPPPQTTNPAGTAGQTAVVAQATGTAAGSHVPTLSPTMPAVPQSLQSLTAAAAADPPTAADPPSITSVLQNVTIGPLSPLSLYGTPGSGYLFGLANYLLPQNSANLTSANERLARDQSKSAAVFGAPGRETRLVGSGGGEVSAGVGRAGLVGQLSVPRGWAIAAPAIKPVVTVLPATGTGIGAVPAALAGGGQGSLFSNMALSSLAGRAVVGSGGSHAGTAGAVGGAAFGPSATTVTIIVIPEDDD